MEKDDKGSTMIRMGVSGWMFLLVPAFPGCPGSKAVKRSLLLLLLLSPAGWLPRTGISSGTLCSAVEYGLPLPLRPDETLLLCVCEVFRWAVGDGCWETWRLQPSHWSPLFTCASPWYRSHHQAGPRYRSVADVRTNSHKDLSVTGPCCFLLATLIQQLDDVDTELLPVWKSRKSWKRRWSGKVRSLPYPYFCMQIKVKRHAV